MLRAPARPQMTRYGRRLRPQMGSESVMRPYSGLIIQGTCAIAFQVSACTVYGSQHSLHTLFKKLCCGWLCKADGHCLKAQAHL